METLTPISNYGDSLSGAAMNVAVSGNTVFLADYLGGLLVLDVSIPSKPTLLGSYQHASGAGAFDVTISGNNVFVADASAGLQIFDTSRATLTGVPRISDADVQINIILKALNETTFLTSTSFTLSVDNPPIYTVPTLLDQSVFPNNTLSLSLQSDFLFHNPSNDFLNISVISSNGDVAPAWVACKLTPKKLSMYPQQNGVSYGVAVSGTTGFVANGNAGLLILDVSVLSNPKFLKESPFSSLCTNNPSVLGVVVSGELAFIANGYGGLSILNISTPNDPSPRTYSFGCKSKAYEVAVSNNIAFVANGAEGLQIWDVSNAVLLSNYKNSTNGIAYGIAVTGNTAFVADGAAGLQILDVSNPRNPKLLFNYMHGVVDNAQGVAISGNVVFVAEGAAGLQILDISNPRNPKPLTNYVIEDGTAQSVVVSGNTIFVAAGNAGLLVLDVSKPNLPVLLGSYGKNDGEYTSAVTVLDDTVFVVDSQGLQILEITHWSLQANNFTINDAGNYHLQILATDKFGGSVLSNSFTLRVEGPPIINGTICTQYAKVNQAFSYFVPQGMFTDPNLDVLSFRATFDNSSLHSWLNFNAFSATFGGVPKEDNIGNYTVVISATDNIFPGSVSTSFNLIVNHVPIVANPIATSLLRSERPFNFTVPSNTFFDPDLGHWGPLEYNAARANNSNIPKWLEFNTKTLTFSGVPPSVLEPINVNLVVTAKNTLNDTALAPLTFSISHNVLPIVIQPIANQEAAVGQAFSFTVPINTFSVLSGDTLFCNTSLVGGSLLPSWLSFDEPSQTFSGTPGRTDTDYYAPKLLSLSVYAYNQPFVYNSYATASFTISVKGVSYLELVVDIFAPIISALTTLYAMYKSRWLVMNPYNKSRYQKPDLTLTTGGNFDYRLSTSLDDVETVEIRLPLQDTESCCSVIRHHGDFSKKLPGGMTLPPWITYDDENNRLKSIMPIPATRHTEMIVRVTSKDYLITEQFKLMISRDRKKLLDRKGAPNDVLELQKRSESNSPNSSSRSLLFRNPYSSDSSGANKSTSKDGHAPLAYTEHSDLHSKLLEGAVV